ncbi:MAG: aryl-sulfate sulfotransferase [Planctomycetes bacterium]|nr:aryl-sulfate sulfotransferase [Planctomycetota bacterium]
MHLVRATSVVCLCALASAQAPGLRLFQAIGNELTSLVDTSGNIVHTWPNGGNLTAHLLPDGSLLRGVQTGAIVVPGATGRLERLAYDGTLLWSYTIGGPFSYMHHDIEPMPNGNVLVIAWDRYAYADAIANGRDPALITSADWLPDSILEIQPTGPTTANIVWEWHMMDHVIQDFDNTKANYGPVASHPELLDINYPAEILTDGDWNHFNGLDYDPVNDWIVFSARPMSEIYIIDHSTTTAEAAGHTGGTHGKGGDFLWRWGNPAAYRSTPVLNHQLTHQHDPRFVPPGYPGAGHVTVFDNEYLPAQSAAVEITLPIDINGHLVLDPSGQFGPAAAQVIYTDPGFVSLFVSSVERMPNGNTLICSGLQNTLFEVDSNGTALWAYNHPTSTMIFQAHYVERSLWNDTDMLSAGGGQVDFDHLTGSSFGGEFYLLLGSISGTSPGTTLGSVTLPLNQDYLTFAMATLFNTGVFSHTIGTLGTNGDAASSIIVGPGYVPQALVGTDMHFAHVIFNHSLAIVRASNAVKVTITP